MSAPATPVSVRRRPARVSVFTELGLDVVGEQEMTEVKAIESPVSSMSERRSKTDSIDGLLAAEDKPFASRHKRWLSRAFSCLPLIRLRSKAIPVQASPQAAFPTMTHAVLLVMLFVLVLPGLQLSLPIGRARRTSNGANASPVGRTSSSFERTNYLVKRQDDGADKCLRWAHQSAVVNGTLYIYGGRARDDDTQKDNTWNNDFLSLSLTKSFQIGSPTLEKLPQPSGPPPVALGFLWNSLTSLFLYGGQFSDTPNVPPLPNSLWEYDLKSSTWKEHKDPRTSAGNNAEPAGRPVERTAEGAGVNVPELGRGWYFGGHLDEHTTEGWSYMVPRVYLKSFIEYTFPGAKNEAVKELAGGKEAGPEGVWRNITEGGLQDKAGFTRRADGVLTYVPGFGEQGILLGLAGGTNESYTQMNVIDVYDIATSTWYKQATDGDTPEMRVNPCATVAAAADGSSYNVHLYGGQNLLPYGSQIQRDDMWILTLPSFTWIKVDTAGQNPPARAGHTCNVWDGQMVVVGGYVGQDLTCDSPGIYVFDLSELTWRTQFEAISGDDKTNQRNQQPSQQKSTEDTNHIGIGGSYGYRVPAVVQKVIGGNENGGATVTAPVKTATSGPLATGKPPTFTITASGAIVTRTGTPRPGDPSGSGNGKRGPNVAAIVAGILAGVFLVISLYFAFCAWIYRRQLALYKNHVAMSQQAAAAGAGGEKTGYMPRSSGGSSDNRKTSTEGTSGSYRGGGGYTALGTPSRGPEGNSSANSSTEDLMAGQEPSFLGVLLSPRRSLRVINRD